MGANQLTTEELTEPKAHRDDGPCLQVQGMRPEGVKGTTSHKKGFELGFAPTPEAHLGANNHTDGAGVTSR